MGGYPSPYTDTEIIELSSPEPENPCSKPPDNSYGGHGMVGGFVGGRPLVCGGRNASSAQMRCSQYSFEDNQWRLTPFAMNEKRYLAASVILPNGTLLVIGGCGGRGTRSTELLMGDRFEYGPDLPFTSYGNCAVLADRSRSVVVIGGGSKDTDKSAFVMDIGSGEWRRINEDMAVGRRYHACGLVKVVKGQEEIVVVGGRPYTGAQAVASTEILNMETMTWRSGIQFNINNLVCSFALLTFSLNFLQASHFRCP